MTLTFRCLSFHPEGNVLFSGSHDSLKIHRWEPSVGIYDHITMGWGKIRDMAIAATQMVRSGAKNKEFSRKSFWSYSETTYNEDPPVYNFTVLLYRLGLRTICRTSQYM